MAWWAVAGIKTPRVRDGGQRRIPVTEAAAIDPTDGNAARDAQRRTWWTPDERLRYAMLAQAFADLRREPAGRDAVRSLRTAEAWLADEDTHWPLAFLPVCEVLGLDPEAVRARAATMGTLPPVRLRPGQRRASRPWIHATAR